MSNPIVFFDIAGPDDDMLRHFYKAILGLEFSEANKFSVDVASPLHGAIRRDPAEKRLYFGVDDVARSLEAVKEAGGSIDSPRFEVPGAVVLGLFRDPAGNPLGFVEMDGDRPKIP